MDSLILFKNHTAKSEIMTLIDFKIEINIINLIYTAKLGLYIPKTSLSAFKIDNFSLKIYSIVIIAF